MVLTSPTPRKRDNAGVPPTKVIQAALYQTTERLASELAGHHAPTPPWSESEWLIARAVAAIHGVSSLLRTVPWRGPPGWHQFLEEQAAHIAARHSQIAELLRAIDGGARGARIGMAAMKGSELHARGLYAPGERPMADIDLFVPLADVERARTVLEAQGFRQSFSMWKHDVFVPRGERAPADLGENVNNSLKIELHSRIREVLPLEIVDITQQVFPSPLSPGIQRYPSTAALMTHLLQHAAGAMVFRALRLVHLHDIALLSSRMTESDWAQVSLQGSSSRCGLWWAWPPLCLTARYYATAVPASVLDAFAACCPRRLRRIAGHWRLSDVSLSHLWIDAFPGINWSHSPTQAARYIVSRVWPSRATRALRGELVRTEVAAAANQWNHLSQSRRLLRWLTSRPARPETMHPVRMALAQLHRHPVNRLA
jgi:Uncharacterised nucleotidyltransferase